MSTTELLAIAEKQRPILRETLVPAKSIITVQADNSEVLGWSVASTIEPCEQPIYNDLDTVIFDFGEHLVGTITFFLRGIAKISPGRSLHGSHVDAPARLRFTFGEILRDVGAPLYPYTGWLSASFLPDELINVDFLPCQVTLPRRYAFRYVKIEMISLSERYGVQFDYVTAKAVTSMPSSIHPVRIVEQPGLQLSPSEIAALERVDRLAITTLRGCMQTVYEDGPRRDMRLWIGDLRLQALTGYTLFDDASLVKRSLALFGGLPWDEDGRVAGCVYEKPYPIKGGPYTVDYSLIFGMVLCEYTEKTQDLEFARMLWAVAFRQVEIVARGLNAEWVFVDDGSRWIFIDWDEGLDRAAAMQGVFIASIQSLLRLSKLLKMPTPILSPFNLSVEEVLEKMIVGARTAFFSDTKGCFVSGPAQQISYSSQAWMIVAGVTKTTEEAVNVLKTVAADETARVPVSPYAHHYWVEALARSELKAEALRYILEYWGSMVDAGATAFFEVWVPSQPELSPYGGAQINSHCHAWSCTPSWFLRKFFVQDDLASD